ncbi:MAG: PEP-CTERM sorting domain-containing protein [Bryobacteraceae bacterium]
MLRAVFLFATVVHAALAVPIDCLPGTLADYIALPADGCQLGPAVFSDFVNPGVLPGSTEISPGSIGVNPLFDPLQPGLLFTYGADAAGPTVLQSVVEFLVSSPSPPGFVFASLEITGNSVTDPGLALATSELCFTGFIGGICTGSSQVLAAFDIGFDSSTFDSRGLAPLSALAVRHDVVVDGGLSGSASLATAELRFGRLNAVPEPATAALVFATLVATIVSTRRRRRH